MKKGIVAQAAQRANRLTIYNPNSYGSSDNDEFGSAVAIHGTRVIAGSQLEDSANAVSSGVAYVFNAGSGNLLYTLPNPDTTANSANDEFGSSVDISATYIAVGCPNADANGYFSSGKVSVYDTATGSLISTIYNPDAAQTSQFDKFGIDVAVTETHLLIGSENGGVDGNGQCYLYSLPNLTLIRTFPAEPGIAYFGIKVGMSDTNIYVVANYRVYTYDAITYALQATVTTNTSAQTTPFGSGYASMAIGEPLRDNYGSVEVGRAYLYAETGYLYTTLVPSTSFTIEPYSHFGKAVASDANYTLVAADRSSPTLIDGMVYLFHILTTEPLKIFYHPPPAQGGNLNSSFGDVLDIHIQLDNSKMVVGAPLNDDPVAQSDLNNSGRIFVYNIEEYINL